MKKLILLLYLTATGGCGSDPIIQNNQAYRPYWPTSVYNTRCRFWAQYSCGYDVFGCDNGIIFHCLSEPVAFRLLTN